MASSNKNEVYFHSADPMTSPWPYIVAAGGRTRVSGRDGMVSRQYHEHTLIMTLSGEGCIKIAGRKFTCEKGGIAWLDTSKKYQHGAQSGHEWHYVWVALSGHNLGRLHKSIGLRELPVVADMVHLRPCFEEIVRLLAERHPAADGKMNAQFIRIASGLFSNRRTDVVNLGSDPVSKVMRHLRDDISRNWNISAISNIAGQSPSQLHRRFKAVCGTSPKSWLRQERMLLARHLLTATRDNIASIALRCGYADPFHFSRDFKCQNGCSPRNFRENAS